MDWGCRNLHSSEVLADAADIGADGQRVHFVDKDIETSEVLDRFLDLACERRLSPDAKGNMDYCTDVGRLVAFLHKYECESLVPCLEIALLKLMTMGLLGVMDVFAIGSAADATFVCTSALEEGARKSCDQDLQLISVGAEREGQSLAALVGGCVLDPATMSLAAARLVRPDHAWALNRAWSLCHVVYDVPAAGDEETEWHHSQPCRLLHALPSKFSRLLGDIQDADDSEEQEATAEDSTD